MSKVPNVLRQEYELVARFPSRSRRFASDRPDVLWLQNSAFSRWAGVWWKARAVAVALPPLGASKAHSPERPPEPVLATSGATLLPMTPNGASHTNHPDRF